MWSVPLYVVIVGLLVYLGTATLYLLVLAVAFFVLKEPKVSPSAKLNRFAILIPAHNEELLISRLCESLSAINYPQELHEVFVIADNCSDRTAEICKAYPVNVLQRDDPSHLGKGFALAWALEHFELNKFDAVFILDADNVVDPTILYHLNQSINKDEQAIQCNNSVGNRADSWFTQLLFVSRTMSNLLYHHSKYKLGLSSYLMGNGICFTSGLLAKKRVDCFYSRRRLGILRSTHKDPDQNRFRNECQGISSRIKVLESSNQSKAALVEWKV